MRQPSVNPDGLDGAPLPPDHLLHDSQTTSLAFKSILFSKPDFAREKEITEAPDFFHDLNLDQVVAAITAKWQDYNLIPFFHARLNDLDEIMYRQEIMRDLQAPALMQAVQVFSHEMQAMRAHLPRADENYYKYQKERLLLGAAETYCGAVEQLGRELFRLDVASRGLRTFREYLATYVASNSFRGLAADAARLASELSNIRYRLLLNTDRVTVSRQGIESDYSSAVEQTFEKFRQGGGKGYRVKEFYVGGENHIQAQVVERVAWLHPDVFRALEAFQTAHTNYLDQAITRFDREVQFYVAYLTYIEKFRRAGLSFCYPRLSRTSKEINSQQSFDLALAGKLVDENGAIVTNDFSLRGSERIFVVTGPNHGGKTTFARTFGQLHYLASLGCPVPGTEAQLFLFDHLLTHFEREEHIETLRGKLQDDLVRIRRIMDQATPNSIVVINEIFSSTTLQDAVYLGKKIMAKLSGLDLLGICVTFLDELSSFDEKTVSIVSTVDPQNPAIRTYKLERRPADGLAYALAVAEKHRVTYDWTKKRIKT